MRHSLLIHNLLYHYCDLLRYLMKRDSTDGNGHRIISIMVIVVNFVLIKRLYV